AYRNKDFKPTVGYSTQRLSRKRSAGGMSPKPRKKGGRKPLALGKPRLLGYQGGVDGQAYHRVKGQANPVTTYPASAYSGIPVRRLWAYIREGRLQVIRPPGMRAVLLDRLDLDHLLEAHKEPA